MIIVSLNGGLGNQMFQYALGRSLAHILKTELKLDIFPLELNPLRAYALNIFNITANFASGKEVSKLTIKNNSMINRAICKIFRRQPKFASTYIKERDRRFNPTIFSLPDNIYLQGYWQSEKYFKPIEHIIREEFTFKKLQQGKNKELANYIKSTESISLHFRRGDYASNKKTFQHHGVCGLDYAFASIKKICNKVQKPTFFIFSDDPKWVHSNFSIEKPMIVVENNNSKKDYDDLRLMSQCKHNIIGNSSFSWWGAWLNVNPEKIVIAPRRYFNDGSDDSDLIPEDWIRV